MCFRHTNIGNDYTELQVKNKKNKMFSYEFGTFHFIMFFFLFFVHVEFYHRIFDLFLLVHHVLRKDV